MVKIFLTNIGSHLPLLASMYDHLRAEPLPELHARNLAYQAPQPLSLPFPDQAIPGSVGCHRGFCCILSSWELNPFSSVPHASLPCVNPTDPFSKPELLA